MGDGLTILNLVWDFCDMAKNGAEAGGSSNKVQEYRLGLLLINALDHTLSL